MKRALKRRIFNSGAPHACKSVHVLHVISNHEKRVAQHLIVRSVEHYLPLYSERLGGPIAQSGGTAALLRYVFVRFQPQNRISVIPLRRATRIGDDERDKVSAAELDKIRIGLAGGLHLRPHPSVSLGTRVRVRNGAFAGVEGVVTELRHQCRVILALSAVRQSFSLELGFDDLELLNKPAHTIGLNPALDTDASSNA